MKFLPTILLGLLAACGSPTASNNQTNSGSDAGANNAVDTSTGGNTSTTSTTTGTACGEIGPRFIDAVRALPRTCVTDADCKIVSRGQVCDCELAVSASSDTAEYEAVRAEVDAAQCANPFGCAVDQCPYHRLSEPGELYAHCGEAGECEVVQILPCSEFEARSRGGIVPAGGCADATQCGIRADLNPCGCGESISENFPFLTVQAVAEMMEINRDRCSLDCAPCDTPGTPVCVDDGAEGMVCAMQ